MASLRGREGVGLLLHSLRPGFLRTQLRLCGLCRERLPAFGLSRCEGLRVPPPRRSERLLALPRCLRVDLLHPLCVLRRLSCQRLCLRGLDCRKRLLVGALLCCQGFDLPLGRLGPPPHLLRHVRRQRLGLRSLGPGGLDGHGLRTEAVRCGEGVCLLPLGLHLRRIQLASCLVSLRLERLGLDRLDRFHGLLVALLRRGKRAGLLLRRLLPRLLQPPRGLRRSLRQRLGGLGLGRREGLHVLALDGREGGSLLTSSLCPHLLKPEGHVRGLRSGCLHGRLRLRTLLLGRLEDGGALLCRVCVRRCQPPLRLCSLLRKRLRVGGLRGCHGLRVRALGSRNGSRVILAQLLGSRLGCLPGGRELAGVLRALLLYLPPKLPQLRVKLAALCCLLLHRRLPGLPQSLRVPGAFLGLFQLLRLQLPF
mmetsp:Transcript_64796/g.202964  ORF Transcript_64796/g.202964 Transcript_64796/m.202964 type:complete len:423 (+) Transcript_64796:1808-3076(+)